MYNALLLRKSGDRAGNSTDGSISRWPRSRLLDVLLSRQEAFFRANQFSRGNTGCANSRSNSSTVNIDLVRFVAINVEWAAQRQININGNQQTRGLGESARRPMKAARKRAGNYPNRFSVKRPYHRANLIIASRNGFCRSNFLSFFFIKDSSEILV